MLLTPEDALLFFRLHRTLMFFVNKQLRVIPRNLSTPKEFASLPPEVRLTVNDALLDHVDLIRSFVDDNPADLADEELSIVRSWQHLVAGQFYFLRELRKYAVFLSSDN